jgi:hypothetical protein
MNSANCDPETGRCKCTPGWRGRRCDKGKSGQNVYVVLLATVIYICPK